MLCSSLGILCGNCIEGLGVSALLNECVTCGDASGLLIAGLGKLRQLIDHTHMTLSVPAHLSHCQCNCYHNADYSWDMVTIMVASMHLLHPGRHKPVALFYSKPNISKCACSYALIPTRSHATLMLL